MPNGSPNRTISCVCSNSNFVFVCSPIFNLGAFVLVKNLDKIAVSEPALAVITRASLGRAIDRNISHVTAGSAGVYSITSWCWCISGWIETYTHYTRSVHQNKWRDSPVRLIWSRALLAILDVRIRANDSHANKKIHRDEENIYST